MGKLREEEEESATQRRREYTDLGLHLDEEEEQVACHATALALAMTDEARREARRKPGDFHRLCELQRKPCVFH